MTSSSSFLRILIPPLEGGLGGTFENAELIYGRVGPRLRFQRSSRWRRPGHLVVSDQPSTVAPPTLASWKENEENVVFWYCRSSTAAIQAVETGNFEWWQVALDLPGLPLFCMKTQGR